MVLKRLKEFIDANNLSIAAFEKSIGMSNASFGKSLKNNGAIGSDKLENILIVYPDINPDWLLTGRGSMLKSEGKSPMGEQEAVLPAKKNLIPFYDDVSTIGGLNDRVANTDPNSPSEWIDAGDWFPEATAAIRHYGDSMVEYSSGSILALRRVNDQRLIMNGRNYVIETSEYRVTKQLQDDGDHFMAYSTNRETYPDGRQIHAPFSIPKDAIRYIYLVLGCVTKEYSNGAIQIRK
jgi:phage repressor protein C with HTH and peptisase S24 domain